jgi:hypothetical protein
MKNTTPSQPVQIPWANTSRSDNQGLLPKNYVEEVANGKTSEMVFSNELFDIVMPYTSFSFLSLGSYHWSVQKFNTAAELGGYSYIVSYKDLEKAPPYSMALASVINDGIYIQDEYGRARISGQFVKDFIIEGEVKTYPNQEVLKIIQKHSANQKSSYTKQLQNEPDQSLLISIAKQNSSEIKDIIFNNYSLVSETLKAFVNIACYSNNFAQLPYIFSHHNCTDDVYLEALDNNSVPENILLSIVNSRQVSGNVIDAAIKMLTNSTDENLFWEIVYAAASNHHTDESTLSYILEKFQPRLTEDLLQKIYTNPNLSSSTLQKHKKHSSLNSEIRRQIIKKIFEER